MNGSLFRAAGKDRAAGAILCYVVRIFGVHNTDSAFSGYFLRYTEFRSLLDESDKLPEALDYDAKTP